MNPDGGSINVDIAGLRPWPRPIWVTMLVDCIAGLDVDVTLGADSWSVEHPVPTVVDPDAEISVVFRRTDTAPPDRTTERSTTPVDCAAIERVGGEGRAEPCAVFALLVERQGDDRGALHVSMAAPLTIDEMLSLPIDGLEVTAVSFESTDGTGAATTTTFESIRPSATGPDDGSRLLEQTRGGSSAVSDAEPVVDAFQITGAWSEIARFVGDEDVYSISFSGEHPRPEDAIGS